MLATALMLAFAVPETTARANIDLDEDLTANMDLQQEDGAGGGYGFKSGGSKSYSKGGSSKGSTGSSFLGTAGKGTKATSGGKSGTGSVDIDLKYKEGWTTAQRAEADAKVKALSNATTVKTSVNRSLGAQIKNAIKDYLDGTVFGQITIH